MQEVVSGNLSQKFHFYSAHDTTVQAVLYGLDLTNQYSWPVFASTIFFELYQDSNGEYFVQTLFNDKLQQLRGCDVKCKINDFVNVINKMTLPNFEEACKIPSGEVPKKIDWRSIVVDGSPTHNFEDIFGEIYENKLE